VTPESKRALEKARSCLMKAKIIFNTGLGDEAGRGAYLAAFHAARAFIFEITRKPIKSHNGVQTLFHELARKNPAIPTEFLPFLSRAYHLKAVADYEEGEGATVPLDKAADAIETASRFVECIADVLANPSGLSSSSAETN
jgi:uncharacterized protein (UPF0332 family)